MTMNNSISMKTVVETYLIEETVNLLYDNEQLSKWNEYVKELGLTAQESIRAEDKSPIPFLYMKANLVNVFETLCPVRVNIENYGKTPIPVELLSLVSMSVKEQYFDYIQVWYDDKTPDPAIIGFKKNDRFDPKYPKWNPGLDKYLIGRWADVKASFEELTEKAKRIYKKSKENDLQQRIKDAQRELEDLERQADNQFGLNAAENNIFI